MQKVVDFKQTCSVLARCLRQWAVRAWMVSAMLLMSCMNLAQAGQTESTPLPAAEFSSSHLCYECTAIIQHMALFHGGVLDEDAIQQITSKDYNYTFRLALTTICSSCLETLQFYEQNVIGHMLTEQEGKRFLQSEEFLLQYNAVASVSGAAFDPPPENIPSFFSTYPSSD